jgi:hypothetical protein
MDKATHREECLRDLAAAIDLVLLDRREDALRNQPAGVIPDLVVIA